MDAVTDCLLVLKKRKKYSMIQSSKKNKHKNTKKTFSAIYRILGLAELDLLATLRPELNPISPP